MYSECQPFRRVIAGPELTVSFVHGGEVYSRLSLVNISENGCFVLVPGPLVDRFVGGAEIEDFTLHHELMPDHPFKARVAYSLGTDAPDHQWTVGVGFQFLEVPVAVSRSLTAFLEAIPEEL